MDWVHELVSGRTGMASRMLRCCDPDLEVELELELVIDDYEIYDFVERPRLVDDYEAFTYVSTAGDDGWFLASDQELAMIEDVELPAPAGKWPFVIGAGFVVTLVASVAVSL